jgi:allophanate hydrolase subunit 1
LTKILVHFRLERAIDEALVLRIRDAQAVYGIERITLAKSMETLTVEYDASRLSPADVEATLRKCGLPVVPA